MKITNNKTELSIRMNARMKLTPLILLLFLLAITTSPVFSQELQAQVVPPSPTAAALAAFGGNSVNRYTGVPDIEIPLYTIRDHEIQLPISLKYNAQGIKVQQEASWAGLGWSLLSGGIITRSIQGLDDFDPSKGFVSYEQLPGSTPNNDPDHQDDEDIIYFKDVAKGEIDGEPDLFYYNFGSFSGKLIFRKQESFSNIIEGVDVRRSTMQFQYNVNSRTWKVIDDNGVRYYFGTKEISKHYSLSEPTPLLDMLNEGNMLPVDYLYDSPSSWYLDSIVGPSGASVNFKYDTLVHRTRSMVYESERKHHLLEVQYCEGNECFGTSSELKALDAVYSASMQLTDDVYLKEIDFRSGKIEFVTDNRLDQSFKDGYSPPQKLKEIKVFSRSGNGYEFFKSYRLYHSYYNHSSNDHLYLRLKLDSLQEITSQIANPPHVFDYITGQLPSKDSKSFDHWGYYNGRNNSAIRDYVSGKLVSTLIPASFILELQPPVYIENCGSSNGWDNECLVNCTENCNSCWTNPFVPKYFFGADREPDPSYSKRGLLRQVTYPTGGYTAFEYEPNAYYDETKKFKKQNLITTESDSTFYISESAFVFIDALVLGDFEPGSVDVVIKKGSDVISYYILEADTINYEYKYLSEGSYQIIFQNKVNDPNINISIDYLVEDDNPIKYGPGLRIKTMSDYTDTNVIASQTNYEYDGEQIPTSGKLMTPLLYQRYELIVEQIPFSDPCADMETYVGHYAVRSGSTILPLSNSAQGSFVGYSSVKEVTNGWIKYHYVNNPDILPDRLLPGLPTRQDMKNGLIARIEFFNTDSNLVRSVDYKYFESAKDSVKALRTYHYYADINVSSALVKYYDIAIANVRKTFQVDSAFAMNGVIVESENYYYDNPSHNFVSRIASNKNGEQVIVKNTYPLDYDTSSTVDAEALALKSMLANHILSPLVEQQVLKVRDNGSKYLVKGNVSRYKEYGGDIIRPQYIHKLSLPTPSLDTTMSRIDGNGNFIYHSQYYPTAEVGPNKYDPSGNLIETISRSGDTTAYIWGYDENYPVAKVINAGYSAIEAVLGENFSLLGESGDNLSALQIEDLRSALPKALITTYTYEPLKGITSETDHNGFKVSYEYDDLGRLKLVRDQDENIIKRYSYQFKVN